MPIYHLPYSEHIKGYYEIEADSLEAARKIVENPDIDLGEPEPVVGEMEYYPEDLYEVKERN